MIELVRDFRVINVLAKLENDPWEIMDVRVLTGLVCPATRTPTRATTIMIKIKSTKNDGLHFPMKFIMLMI